MLSLSGALETLRRRDPAAIALDAIARLDTLAPVTVPADMTPSPELRRCLRGECTAAELGEVQRAEHVEWLATASARTRAREENLRRVRHTLWAEAKLRERGELEGARMLRDWHVESWSVPDPASSDVAERERQATACIRRLMR